MTLSRDPATCFLTATTLTYAITAAAGNRLALQSILKNKLYSIQLQDMDVQVSIM